MLFYCYTKENIKILFILPYVPLCTCFNLSNKCQVNANTKENSNKPEVCVIGTSRHQLVQLVQGMETSCKIGQNYFHHPWIHLSINYRKSHAFTMTHVRGACHCSLTSLINNMLLHWLFNIKVGKVSFFVFCPFLPDEFPYRLPVLYTLKKLGSDCLNLLSLTPLRRFLSACDYVTLPIF